MYADTVDVGTGDPRLPILARFKSLSRRSVSGVSNRHQVCRTSSQDMTYLDISRYNTIICERVTVSSSGLYAIVALLVRIFRKIHYVDRSTEAYVINVIINSDRERFRQRLLSFWYSLYWLYTIARQFHQVNVRATVALFSRLSTTVWFVPLTPSLGLAQEILIRNDRWMVTRLMVTEKVIHLRNIGIIITKLTCSCTLSRAS